MDDASPVTRRRKGPKVAAVVGLVVAIGIAVGTMVVRARVQSGWDRLRAAASAFQAPSGWTEEKRGESGTYWCVMSCLDPTVRSVYFTTDAPEQACEVARQAVEDQIGPTVEHPYHYVCGPWLTGLGEGAYVTATACPALTLEELASNQFAQDVGPPYCRQGEGVSPAGTFVWLDFVSGID